MGHVCQVCCYSSGNAEWFGDLVGLNLPCSPLFREGRVLFGSMRGLRCALSGHMLGELRLVPPAVHAAVDARRARTAAASGPAAMLA